MGHTTAIAIEIERIKELKFNVLVSLNSSVANIKKGDWSNIKDLLKEALKDTKEFKKKLDRFNRVNGRRFGIINSGRLAKL